MPIRAIALPARLVIAMGSDPIDAVRNARRAGWDGPVAIETAAGEPIMTAAAGWDGTPIW